MANNKVVYGNTTIMDITDTTAEASDVANGQVFYDKSGVRTVGTGNYMDKVSSPTANDILIDDGNGQAIDSGTDLNQLLLDVEAGKEAFILKDFGQQIDITIPSCLNDIANTSIPNVDIDLNTIDPTGELNSKYAIASLMKYEVYDNTSGGNRLNAFQVCSFSMNTQRTLRLRMMVAGPNAKSAKRISGALLLKHR